METHSETTGDQSDSEKDFWEMAFMDAKSHQSKALNDFEDELYKVVRTIEFRNSSNEFQRQLAEDVKDIKKATDVLVFADKTTNIYRVSTDAYQKLLHDNITKTYKKTDEKLKNNINKEAKEIAKKLGLDNRMQGYANSTAFITLKDHKENFQSNTKCRDFCFQCQL